MDCDLLDVMTLEGERSTHVHGCTQFVQLSSCLISHDRFLLSISPKPCVRGVTKHNSDQVRNSELVGNTKSHRGQTCLITRIGLILSDMPLPVFPGLVFIEKL